MGGEPREEIRLSNSPLDDILASRSHIRVLRVLALLGNDINLTGRDIARRAGISRTRAQAVLVELVASSVVARYPGATWAIYEINVDHPMAEGIPSLFKAERQLTSA